MQQRLALDSKRDHSRTANKWIVHDPRSRCRRECSVQLILQNWRPMPHRKLPACHPNLYYLFKQSNFVDICWQPDVHPSKMTLVSNDPTLWSLINVYHVSSYYIGSCSWTIMVIRISLYLGLPWLGHVVASVTAVAYDWGERGNTYWIINVLMVFISAYIRTRGSYRYWSSYLVNNDL